LPAPTLLVVGDVVRFADHATLRKQLARIRREQRQEFAPLVAEEGFVSEEQEPGE
jgi:hypothetical protein